MEVQILPAHDGLDDRMEFSDGCVRLGEHPPPYHGGYAAKMNLQLVDCFGETMGEGHPAKNGTLYERPPFVCVSNVTLRQQFADFAHRRPPLQTSPAGEEMNLNW